MSPEEHYAKAEELLEWAANDECPELLTARAQVHATLALFTPAVYVNVQNPKSADEIYRQREEGARLARNPEALRKIKAALSSTTGDTIIPPSAEEAKAETYMDKMVRKGSIAKLLERTLIADDGWRLPTGWDPGVLAGAIVYGVAVTGSPAVPAPTETGPWQRIDDVPVGVPFVDREGSELVKLADGTFGYLNSLRETGLTMAEFAPFVAAEKEEA